MLTLMTASTIPQYQSRIGKFSQTMTQVVTQLSKDSDEKQLENSKKLTKNTVKPSDQQSEDNMSIIEDLEEDIVDVKELGIVSTVSSFFKWIKKMVKVNALSLTFHVSFLLFLRELSKKSKR